ncbi:glycoside hydrolase family 13 protein [Nocardioides seonyuensis]|uniref:Glycoside hydrolase family 13 protein n=1 Tax=Nocardioides seonyuensis TaxID=2518371 RepID=A0A4P7IGV9_9ACTN|nr:glycoside hydrolase family 13 protein [Nocardioides seonyuensis]QBX56000.1 glycoside hydrolase family 13 protein [Nocardioides seonyuensis]
MSDAAAWWRDAVIYEIYVRSFADSNGDGIGDLPGITSRLPHLRDLGVDAVWLTPFYRSPQKDHGYDVSDYRDVDPLFGSLSDADDLVRTAHDLGLRVIVDLVPNHTSDQHEWFRAALAAGPGSPERDRYLFRDGVDGKPPNNWESVFGGPAWTQVPGGSEGEGQFYLHLFDSSQPDLNWRNPEVPAMFEEVLRFWLDRGVDGFRVDVAHGLFKEEGLRDQVEHEPHVGTPGSRQMVERVLNDEPMWDQPEVHDVYRSWHRILDEAGPERMAVAEAWTQTPESMARFVRPDELDQAFNFAWLLAPWSASEFARVITETIAAVEPVGASPTWVLSNHDVVRHPTRYGGGAQGLARARAATLAMLALPGSSYLYQGEELGLEEVDVAPEDRQDPTWLRQKDSPDAEKGRDGCRVPIPWSGDEPPFGFGPGAGQPWIPQPADWAPLTVDAQDDDADSTLGFYRRALAARREHAVVAGDTVELLDQGKDTLAFRRGPLTVLLNCGTSPVPLPPGEVLVSSGPVTDRLPPDTSVWLR